MEQDENIKDRRITKPQHVRQTLTEQMNILRKLKLGTVKEQQDNARTITYISNTILTAMRDGELSERMESIEELLQQVLATDKDDI